MSNIWYEISKIIVFIFEIYFITGEFYYIYKKYVKKDIRFQKVGLFKFLYEPMKTMKRKEVK